MVVQAADKSGGGIAILKGGDDETLADLYSRIARDVGEIAKAANRRRESESEILPDELQDCADRAQGVLTSESLAAW